MIKDIVSGLVALMVVASLFYAFTWITAPKYPYYTERVAQGNFDEIVNKYNIDTSLVKKITVDMSSYCSLVRTLKGNFSAFSCTDTTNVSYANGEATVVFNPSAARECDQFEDALELYVDSLDNKQNVVIRYIKVKKDQRGTLMSLFGEKNG